jgi:adenylyltransferase/sulfurtransferase
MQHITVSALKQKLLEGEDIFLLDVREPFEHEEYNIGGTLIPLNDVIKQAGIIPADKPVVVYCRKGIRSQIAIQRLQEKFSFNNLINLEGGIESWKRL